MKLFRLKKNLHIKVVENPHTWNKNDVADLKAFLSSQAGRKLLDNLHYTTYDYVIRAEAMSDFRRGVITGFVMFLNALKDGAQLNDFPESLPPEEKPSESKDRMSLYDVQ